MWESVRNRLNQPVGRLAAPRVRRPAQGPFVTGVSAFTFQTPVLLSEGPS